MSSKRLRGSHRQEKGREVRKKYRGNEDGKKKGRGETGRYGDEQGEGEKST